MVINLSAAPSTSHSATASIHLSLGKTMTDHYHIRLHKCAPNALLRDRIR